MCSVGCVIAVAMSLTGCAPDETVAPGSSGAASPSPSSDAPSSATGTPADSGDGVAAYGAQPVLTFAAWNAASNEVVASGFVDGTLDAGLECEFEFTGDAGSLTMRTTPEPGPSSLDCGSVYVSVDELGPGGWSVVLVYGTARSEVQRVEVP